MKRAFWVALLIAVLLGAFAAVPPSALAWGPCDGPYGGYAGCNYYNYQSSYSGGYYGGYMGGYYGGYGYNRVCYWYGWGAYRRLYCTYVRVPAYPASGYYGYANPYYGGYSGMYGGYGY
jgi:hypothetical protein